MGVMLSVKDLVVNYGAINAIKGISFDVNEGCLLYTSVQNSASQLQYTNFIIMVRK